MIVSQTAAKPIHHKQTNWHLQCTAI